MCDLRVASRGQCPGPRPARRMRSASMVRWLFAAVVLLYAVRPAMARSVDDRVSLGGDITIAAGETGGDVVCVFCSIHIHGDTRGDVVAVLGSVTVDSG